MRIDPNSAYKKYQTITSKAEAGAKGVSGPVFKEGDVIKGEVIDASQNRVSVRLESGEVLKARVVDANPYAIGDQVTFVVKEAGGEQTLISPLMDSTSQELNQLVNILSDAGIPKSEATLDMLKCMMEKEMPVDQESLKQMVRLVNKHPEAPIRQLIFLVKHNIPVNGTNLQQLQMLENNEQSLMRSMASLVDDLSTALTNQTEKGFEEIANGPSLQPVLDLIAEDKASISFQRTLNLQIQTITNVTSEMTAEMTTEMTTEMTAERTPGGNVQSVQNEQNITAGNSTALGQVVMASDLEALSAKLMNYIEPVISAGQLTEGQQATMASMPEFEQMVLQDIFKLFEQAIITQDQLRDFLVDIKQASTYQALAKGLLMSDIKIVEDGEINAWFNKIQNKVQKILVDTSEVTANEAVNRGATEVKASVEFLNSLQQDYQFMHLPMLLNDQLLNSELYVLNNKKAYKGNSESITALVRLDLLNLGHTDIYVKKVGKNIDIQFYMTEEKQISVMQENVYKLHKMLVNKGFNVLSATVQSLERRFDVVDDFLDKNGESTEYKRVSFDMRV